MQHKLAGKKFGPLEVVCAWGFQSTNLAWVYYCRACGHIGKRQGTQLVRDGRTTCCPACRAGRRPYGRLAAKPPTKEELGNFFAHDPPSRQPPQTGGTAAAANNRDITNWPTSRLRTLADRIQSELTRRGDEEVSAMDICSHCEGRLDRVGVHRVSDGQGGMRHSACPSTTEPR